MVRGVAGRRGAGRVDAEARASAAAEEERKGRRRREEAEGRCREEVTRRLLMEMEPQAQRRQGRTKWGRERAERLEQRRVEAVRNRRAAGLLERRCWAVCPDRAALAGGGMGGGRSVGGQSRRMRACGSGGR